jgi:hypothetical protein
MNFKKDGGAKGFKTEMSWKEKTGVHWILP